MSKQVGNIFPWREKLDTSRVASLNSVCNAIFSSSFWFCIITVSGFLLISNLEVWILLILVVVAAAPPPRPPRPCNVGT